ncbi:MAG: YsnF/AvaK domain-containing protein [Thermoleophilia bacterium]|nr:YsnF/AvaK domain-containing protein [Thermoleophilia bacterium]
MEERDVIRHEEEARVRRETVDAGSVRARKEVTSERVVADVPRDREELVLDRAPPDPDDPGDVLTLPDGSISIPVYEEELVVEKRLVLRERVVIRKETVTDVERVEVDLRRERVEVSGAEEDVGTPAP